MRFGKQGGKATLFQTGTLSDLEHVHTFATMNQMSTPKTIAKVQHEIESVAIPNARSDAMVAICVDVIAGSIARMMMMKDATTWVTSTYLRHWHWSLMSVA